MFEPGRQGEFFEPTGGISDAKWLEGRSLAGRLFKGIRVCGKEILWPRKDLRDSLPRMSDQLDGPYLPAVGPVAALSEEDRGTLSSYGDFHLANQGDVLISQGDSHGRLFFVISGVLHAVRRDEDREVLLGAVRMGEWVGEVDLFDPVSAMCSVVVIEQAQYWAIDRQNLEEFINNYPQAGIQLVVSLASLLSRRLRSVTRRLMEEAELAVVRASLLVEP